jgi:hypothetical protein
MQRHSTNILLGNPLVKFHSHNIPRLAEEGRLGIS